MLAHQFILVLVGTVKRFESVLLSGFHRLRDAISGERSETSDAELEEVETEQAA